LSLSTQQSSFRSLPTLSSSYEILSLAFVSDSDIFKLLNIKKSSKYVGDDGIHGLIVKDGSDKFVPVLKHNSNLSKSQ
jgi:hypothetical protein